MVCSLNASRILRAFPSAAQVVRSQAPARNEWGCLLTGRLTTFIEPRAKESATPTMEVVMAEPTTQFKNWLEQLPVNRERSEYQGARRTNDGAVLAKYLPRFAETEAVD